MINIDQSGTNKEAIRTYTKRCCKKDEAVHVSKQSRELSIDQVANTEQMLGFQSFQPASRTLTGIEMMSMKGQVNFPLATSYGTFYSLAA